MAGLKFFSKEAEDMESIEPESMVALSLVLLKQL
jgi:hypothetical protein